MPLEYQKTLASPTRSPIDSCHGGSFACRNTSRRLRRSALGKTFWSYALAHHATRLSWGWHPAGNGFLLGRPKCENITGANCAALAFRSVKTAQTELVVFW